MGIYKITNNVNGKVYIGSSKNIENRWKQHKRELKKGTHHSQHLQKSWDIYKKENFSFEMIEDVDDLNKLLEREAYYIEKYNSLNSNYGYNEKSVCNEFKFFNHQDINTKLKVILNYKGDILEPNSYEHNEEYIKIYNKEIAYAKVKYNISPSELSFFYLLSSYLKYEDSLLVNSDGNSIMQTELADSLEIDRRTAIRNLNGLTNKKVLYRIKDSQRNLYFVNPFLMYFGEEINPLYPLLFTEIAKYEPLENIYIYN